MSYTIRTYGDPVLKTVASRVDDVDGKIIRLVDDMFDTLVDSGNGIALAAPQIGVQKQVVVWDIDDEPLAIINPEIVESDGEWVYDEGCLSIPGLYVEMLRPKTVLVRGVDLDGEIIEIEADELEARMFQHEIDHLNGVLMFDRLEGDQRKEAMKEYRRIEEEAEPSGCRNPISGASVSADRPPTVPHVKLVYLGTPEMAVPPLRALVAAGHEVVLVVTRVDKRRGRGSELSPSPVKAAALELGLAGVARRRRRVVGGAGARRRTRRGRGVRADHQAARARRAADGQPPLLAAAALAWRRARRAGAAGRRRGDRRVRDGAGGGPRHRRRLRPSRGPDRCGDHGRRAARASSSTSAPDLLVDTLAAAARRTVEPQVGEVTYAAKFTSADFEIDWTRPGAGDPPADPRRRSVDDVPRQAAQDHSPPGSSTVWCGPRSVQPEGRRR